MPEIEDIEIEQILSEADPDEHAKIAAFVKPSNGQIGDYTFHTFNGGRKLLLLLSGLDRKLIASFSALEQSVGVEQLKSMKEEELGGALLKADPEAYFHFCALAFICIKDGKDLSLYRSHPELIESASFEWQDGLDEKLLAELINRSAICFFESTVGQDFQVAGDGKPPDPNALPRAGSRPTSSPSAGAGLPRTKRKRSGATSRSVAAGSISMPTSP